MIDFSKWNSNRVRIVVATVVLAGLSVSTVMAQSADSKASITGSGNASSHSWTTEQLLTCTVREAWVMSGRNEDQFFDMVQTLAGMSAQKRGLMLPDNQTAGEKAGEWIKKEAKRDPDELLYAVVDKAVTKTGVKNSMASK